MTERYYVGYRDPTPHVRDPIRKPDELGMLPAIAGLVGLLCWITAILLLGMR